jgi:hypothetical protein
MLGSVALLFIVLWLFGLVTAISLGGFIHLLPVAAVLTFVLHVIRSRREHA